MKLIAYTSSDFSGGGNGTYVCKVNPEKFTLSRAITYDKDKTNTSAGKTIKFKGYEEDTLAFDLHFDGTGVLGPEKQMDVAAEIDALEDVVYNYQGSEHKPNYVKVIWNSFTFKGALKSLKIDYTLFKADGAPLRAKATLNFMEFLDEDTRERRANNSSPDLSHVKTVRTGDRLPLMCRDIYGDFNYFLQVAEANNLTNFRNLELGSQILFPPLEK